MPPPEPFLIFAEKLNALGIPYRISGSFAAFFGHWAGALASK